MISTTDFIDQILQDVHTCKNIAEQHWLTAPPEALNWSDSRFGWSIQDIMDHLAAFPTHYLPNIEEQIELGLSEAIPSQKTYTIEPTIINFFNALSYEGLEHMESVGHFKEIDKKVSTNYQNTLPNFVAIQDNLIQLLESAKAIDLEKLTIPSIIAETNFQLGDCFLFLVKHQILHFAQAEIIMEAYTKQHLVTS